MFDIHKESRKDVTTFEDFFKEQKNPPKPKPATTDKWKDTQPLPKRDEFSVNNILDDDDALSVTGARRGGREGMRAPLARRNEESRSVAPKRTNNVDEGKSMVSIGELGRNQQDLMQPPKLPQEPMASMALSTAARDDG